MFMIFGPIKTFSCGAYGMAEFTPAGLSEFRTNNAPLQMAAMEAEGSAKPQPKAEPAQFDASLLDVTALGKGHAFYVSKPTPFMPEPAPSNPIEALSRAKVIPAGGAFRVTSVSRKNNTTWYQAIAIDAKKKRLGSGWINSTALMGQTLKPYKPTRR